MKVATIMFLPFKLTYCSCVIISSLLIPQNQFSSPVQPQRHSPYLVPRTGFIQISRCKISRCRISTTTCNMCMNSLWHSYSGANRI